MIRLIRDYLWLAIGYLADWSIMIAAIVATAGVSNVSLFMFAALDGPMGHLRVAAGLAIIWLCLRYQEGRLEARRARDNGDENGR